MPQTLSLNLVHVIFSTKDRYPFIRDDDAPVSVGPADLDTLVRYIDTQKAHHARRSFQDEMRAFCEKYHVAFDERYVWN